MASTASMLCLILVTLFIPPLGVLMISGCSVDFFINILLTILGHLPGHIHAFYLEYVYYRNSSTDPMTRKRAPGVYSQRILQGHDGRTYGSTA
ncbi:YqaE/Pmp3 family membrane protein [Aspergillus fumigatus Af293]|uniref:Stress response RCI peptide, putative n=1 Tax=Aspergillus fumigatus (strain ATCC MYA-4609 / CBS 101355 / FGSC A1100 / Af293) TaxID=330879 RepID=Q4WEJ5_ASPFU|nr:stress response RCI peptide, putative [Aspergillus fumigatus Af293]EAL85982.1 stress response RCI peptide, putative [Aspergillus fumigatus Af293]